MDILITDYHCASNRGDAAILEGELAALQNEFPEASFTVMTDYPDAAELLHNVDVVEQSLTPFEFSDLKGNFALSVSLFSAWLPIRTQSIFESNFLKDHIGMEAYYEADLVVSTGGQFITDIYFPNKLAVLAELYLCKLLGKTVVIYGQTLGPFKTSKYRSVIRHVLNSLDVIITRDEDSVEYLNKLGVTEPPIYSQADPAFTMPIEAASQKPLQENIGEEIRTVTNSKGPVISISARNWSHFNSKTGEKEYFQAIAAAADYLLEERNAKVIFASTCTGLSGYHTDDRVAAHRIIQRMENGSSDSVEILSGEYTPQQLVSFFENIDLHIGTRMHSNILAMMAETLVIPIEYQFKTKGLMRMFDLEELLLDIEHVRGDSIIAKVEDVHERRDEIMKKIRGGLQEMEQKSEQSASIIRRSISQE